MNVANRIAAVKLARMALKTWWAQRDAPGTMLTPEEWEESARLGRVIHEAEEAYVTGKDAEPKP